MDARPGGLPVMSDTPQDDCPGDPVA